MSWLTGGVLLRPRGDLPSPYILGVAQQQGRQVPRFGEPAVWRQSHRKHMPPRIRLKRIHPSVRCARRGRERPQRLVRPAWVANARGRLRRGHLLRHARPRSGAGSAHGGAVWLDVWAGGQSAPSAGGNQHFQSRCCVLLGAFVFSPLARGASSCSAHALARSRWEGRAMARSLRLKQMSAPIPNSAPAGRGDVWRRRTARSRGRQLGGDGEGGRRDSFRGPSKSARGRSAHARPTSAKVSPNSGHSRPTLVSIRPTLAHLSPHVS